MAEVLSASAKKRLAKKARDEKAAEEAAPPAVAPKAAAAKASGKAAAKPAAAPPAAAAAAAKAEVAPAKAKAKAKPAAQPVCVCGNVFSAESMFCNKCGAKRPAEGSAPAAPKAAAKADPKKAAEPAKAEAKVAAKAEGKKAAKAKSTPKESTPPKAPENLMAFSFEDDGTGGWDAVSGQAKKKDKQKDKQEKKAEEAKAPEQAPQTNAAPKAKIAAKEKQPDKVSTSGMSAAQKMIAELEEEATAKAKKAIEAKALADAVKGRGKGKNKDGEEGEGEEVKVNPNFISAQVTVPSEKMGRIIGPQGKTLAMITEKTGVDRIDTLGDVCTIIGDPEPVKKCEVAIREMVEKGYMSMAYENFTEESVMVHPDNFPALIGQRGAIIRKIKEELNVEINIPADVTKDANGRYGKKKYPVQLAGSGDGVQKAKEVIHDIVYFKHHPITHPETAHHEMEVEEWAYRYIIGPKGSEMRHIQNSFKVDVNIPRETHADTGSSPNVLIVGPQDGVDKAKAHIEKLIHNAENEKKATKREDAPADDDRNKGDDDVDAEAAKYLIKRKQ